MATLIEKKEKIMDKSEYGSAILDIMPDGLLIVDPEGMILDLNPAALRMLGYEAEELIGKSCKTLNCSGCTIFEDKKLNGWCALFKDENEGDYDGNVNHRQLHLEKKFSSVNPEAKDLIE